jgi:hypothetical protein
MKRHLDFIVIGAQKAGTTALFEYLRRHPQISLPAGKEAPYFSHDSSYARPWEEYLAKAFAFADPARKWGTVTTHYMVGGLYEASDSSVQTVLAGDELTVPRRIRERLPEVRLIAVLRDPAERALSHHRMMAMTGAERRPFSQAIEELLAPDALDRARNSPRETTGYVVWGEYGRILAGYMDVFEREQLLVVFSEDLRERPRETLAQVYDFIAVADAVPDNLGETYRVGASRRRLERLNLYRAQSLLAGNRTVQTLWRSLPPPARRHVDHAFARASYRVDLWNRRHGSGAEEPAEDTVGRLRSHFRADGERLSSLLGTVPPWHSLAEKYDSANV